MRRLVILLLALLVPVSVQAQTPTLVQHVHTGFATLGDSTTPVDFKIALPNVTLSGNTLVLGFQYADFLTLTSVTDDKGNTWVAGPTSHNASTGGWIAIYSVIGATVGTRVVTIRLANTFSAQSHYLSAALSEFYNVGVGTDGSSATNNDASSPYTAGNFTTTTAGDLIWTYGAGFGSANGNLSRLVAGTAGSGFTLLGADVNAGGLNLGTVSQYQVQASAGAINSDFSTLGDTSAIWAHAALALKAASAGTAPTLLPRIVRIQHQYLGPTAVPFQFPSSGNLIVGLFTTGSTYLTAMTDSAGNTWSFPASAKAAIASPNAQAQIVYAFNATTSSTLRDLTPTYSPAPPAEGHPFLVLYDIAGGGDFDSAGTATGNQTTFGDLTTASVTPTTSAGLVFGTISISVHDAIATVGAAYLFDATVETTLNDGQGVSPNSPLDEDNGYAHVLNGDTSAKTFIWQFTGPGPVDAGILKWAAVAAAFKSASAPAPGASRLRLRIRG